MTGTPLKYSKVDACKWLFAACLLTTARNGTSSTQLSKELDTTQRTALYMLHRLRLAASNGRVVLGNEVKVDETYISGLERNKHASRKLNTGRGSVGTQAILRMRERDGNVTAMPIDSPTQETVHELVHENVAERSTLYTDDHSAYCELEAWAYDRESVCSSAGEYVNGMAYTHGIESVWAIINRGFHGVNHRWSPKLMQAYVDEFAFRLNAGNVRRDTQERLDSLFLSMRGKTIIYEALAA